MDIPNSVLCSMSVSLCSQRILYQFLNGAFFGGDTSSSAGRPLAIIANAVNVLTVVVILIVADFFFLNFNFNVDSSPGMLSSSDEQR